MGRAGYRNIASLVIALFAFDAKSIERGDVCKLIPDDAKRLKCFDEIFKPDAMDDPAITVCESSVLSHIVSPATYKRSKATILGDKVYISFDSQNYAGGLIRSQIECVFVREKEGIRLHYPIPSAEMIVEGSDFIDPSKTAMSIPYVPPAPPAQVYGPDTINFSAMTSEGFKSDCASRAQVSSADAVSAKLLTEADGSKTVYLPPAGKNKGPSSSCHYDASGKVTVSIRR